ncbi:MAG: T9SS type A sorting domain-containing protein [Lentimicrobium sp.]|nr:T9SS type A sorting domain-containing protein [Lentimicrobium sp.]
MKRQLLVLAIFGIFSNTYSQTILKYETHAILAESKNSMKLAEYIDPGIAGKSVIWNFTELKLTENFEGTAEQAGYSEEAQKFPMANVIVEEFGNHFFFKVSEDEIEQYGFLSADKLTLIEYDVPFVKMKFPFAFGNSYKGDYHGFINKSCSNGTITGTYSLVADGLGSLLLPGEVSYDNALRIKETKTYTQLVNGMATETEIVTYRWFINENRYPIMAIIIKTFNNADGTTTMTTQTAYNPLMFNKPGSVAAANSLAGEMGFKAYPNPFNELVNIEFSLLKESIVNLSVFNMNGQAIKQLIDGKLQAGSHSETLSVKEMLIPRGNYLLKLNVNGVETSLKIVRQ